MQTILYLAVVNLGHHRAANICCSLLVGNKSNKTVMNMTTNYLFSVLPYHRETPSAFNGAPERSVRKHQNLGFVRNGNSFNGSSRSLWQQRRQNQNAAQKAQKRPEYSLIWRQIFPKEGRNVIEGKDKQCNNVKSTRSNKSGNVQGE